MMHKFYYFIKEILSDLSNGYNFLLRFETKLNTRITYIGINNNFILRINLDDV